MASNFQSNDSDHETKLKVALVGDCGVGKSSLMLKFAEDIFLPHKDMSVGIDWRTKFLNINGRRVKLQIWDTAGQERFSSLVPLYSRNADGVLMIYDITRLSTFQNVEYWLERVGMPMEAELVLIGNKLDMEENRIVTTGMGRSKAQDLTPGDVPFFETSAKNNINVDEIFRNIVSRLLAKEGNVPSQTEAVVSLTDGVPKKSNCCFSSSIARIFN